MANHNNPQPVDQLIRQLIILRESRGIKQARLAHMMVSTQTSVSEMERGHVDPKFSRVRAYAKALQVDLYLGDADRFPDLGKMSTRELMDLFYLLGDTLSLRLASPAAHPADPVVAPCCAAIRGASCDYC